MRGILPTCDGRSARGCRWSRTGTARTTTCFYGKDGELTGKDKEGQEISMLALHLLQSALVHVNTLLVQEVLAEPKWADKLTEADGAASPRLPGPT
ncbi:Tn3 family transposase [Streptomyces sp. NPDC048430]|uniref:Tn3 family transposase n=1 Tax=Streptomyces sp. NPDC048430 TaxID=3155388 RepID=UPI00343BD22C